MAILGMNNMKNSSKSLLSLYQYSYVIELEQSSLVDHLAYRTLRLIIHATYMVRIRAKLRWRFIVPSGVPMSYACRSIGSESQGDVGSFCVIRHGALVHRDR